MRYFWIILFSWLALCAGALPPAADAVFAQHDYSGAVAVLQQELAQDSTNVELWRALGFAHSRCDQPAEALQAYERVLQLQPADYDATLAAARLQMAMHHTTQAEELYRGILNSDSTDVEALWGLADVAVAAENYQQAVAYLETSLALLPQYVPTLLKLGRYYSYINRLDDAISSYREVTQLQPDNTEAWNGVGRMYWWKGQPYSAVKWYRQALALDSTNAELLEEWHKVQQEMTWNGQAKLVWTSEEEDESTIYSLTQQYAMSKLLTNRLYGKVTSLWQWNRKEYDNSALQQEKWVDETTLRLQWRGPHLWRVGGTFGGSKDGEITRGMLDVSAGTTVFGIQVKNALVAGQERFNHWYNLHHRYIDNHLELGWKGWIYNVSYRAGVVEKTYIRHDTQRAENPFIHYSWQLSRLLYKPMNLTLNCYWKRMDFTYLSSRYYTPQDRRMWGGGASLYYPLASWYVYGSGAIEQDSDGETGYNADAELGWQQGGLSLSIGGGMFHNPWYTSRTVSAMATVLW
jgi:cytochrome c-type biogenesis protein CcmH/NrfG